MRDHSTRHLWTTFSDDQIDLNYRSPEVLLAMVDVLLCYLAKVLVCPHGCRWLYVERAGNKLHPSGKNTSDYQTVTVDY